MQNKLYGLLLALFIAGCPKNECESQTDCNDDNACTQDVCSAGTCQNGGAVSVDDNDACTTDSCDPATGVSHDPVVSDDNDACTTDACDPITGVSNTPLAIDDNNDCTVDACDANTGVSHTPIAGIDDGDACTTDVCDTATGQVSHNLVAVEDNNVCTVDACDTNTGVSHTPIPTTDNNACTADACDPVTGVSHTAIAIDDNNACTTDTCDPVTGVSHTNINTDDNNACTTDACDPVTGVSHTPINISDNSVCTTDACDPVTGVSHTPISITDNDACTTDACDPTNGVTHTAININDNIDCTIDACNSTTGNITHTEDDTQCAESDGATCSLPSCDANQGGCVETPIDFLCGDSQACTTADVCNPAAANGDPITGCVFTIDNAACTDNVGCTDDVCTPNSGCSNTPNNNNCQNGDTCDPTLDCIGNLAALTQGVITEFMALGTAGNVGEFIEIHNPGSTAGDLDGGIITNGANQTAIIHPANNPTGAGLIVVPPGGFVFGVPNPANPANIPPGAAFVYGDPGTTFEIADAGDNLLLKNRDNTTLDTVNFVGNFVTNPDTALSAAAFPGVAGASTQLDPTHLNTADNDSGANWCTTFRLFDTAGEANLSCAATTLVINEIVYDGALGADTADARKSFIELAGPGGATISKVHVRGVEGAGATVGNIQGPDILLGALLPNVRMPVDGLFVIADNTGGVSQTVPANQLDLQTSLEPAAGNTFENGDDALQLLLDNGVGGAVLFIDAVGYSTDGLIEDASDNTNNLATFEGTPALDANQGVSLARNLASEDTNNNIVDFVTDPSPSPGVPNQPVNSTITSILPNDGLFNVTTPVVITGTDLGFNATITFAGVAVPTANCNFNGTPTTITCNIPPTINAGTRGDVIYVNTADRGGDTASVFNGWTYTGVLNETNAGPEADFCNLQFPATTITTVNTPSELIFGQYFEAGITDVAVGFPAANITGEVGFGPTAVNPTTTAGWIFSSAIFNVETGPGNNNDEYKGTLTIPVAGTFAYTYRFSIDGGLNFTYCDLNGAGANGGLDFEANQLGSITVQ